MSDVQTYANHRRLPWYHLAAGAALLANAAYLLYTAVRHPACGAWLGALAAVALLVVWHRARRNPQIMQDRIIRLEMRVRLAGLGRGDAFARLTLPQLVALRFASDAELPALLDRVLAGELTGNGGIKRAIREWQPDHLRV